MQEILWLFGQLICGVEPIGNESIESTEVLGLNLSCDYVFLVIF
jgi:hypothetical protein